MSEADGQANQGKLLLITGRKNLPFHFDRIPLLYAWKPLFFSCVCSKGIFFFIDSIVSEHGCPLCFVILFRFSVAFDAKVCYTIENSVTEERQIIMKIHFLGTGAADWDPSLATADHNFRRLSSILVDDCLLVDPGPCLPEFVHTLLARHCSPLRDWTRSLTRIGTATITATRPWIGLGERNSLKRPHGAVLRQRTIKSTRIRRIMAQ